jgi:hypothetical protein
MPKCRTSVSHSSALYNSVFRVGLDLVADDLLQCGLTRAPLQTMARSTSIALASRTPLLSRARQKPRSSSSSAA